ncbi:MAG: hypothetical protein WCG27_07235, partial [Pseudomonadota bacterium]
VFAETLGANFGGVKFIPKHVVDYAGADNTLTATPGAAISGPETFFTSLRSQSGQASFVYFAPVKVVQYTIYTSRFQVIGGKKLHKTILYRTEYSWENNIMKKTQIMMGSDIKKIVFQRKSITQPILDFKITNMPRE